MRTISLNLTYNLRLFFKALALICCSLFLMPGLSGATPWSASASDIQSGDWRAYYRDKLFVDIYTHDRLDSLKALGTDLPLIGEAIEQRIAGHWKLSVDTLAVQASEAELINQREFRYALGLIYESLALFPEATSYYERVDSESGESGEELYYKSLLAMSYIKFFSGMKVSTAASINEADGGFKSVFERSANETQWLDALSAHAVMLYFAGAHDDAERIFQSVLVYRWLKPAGLFIQAENYMNLRRYNDAQSAFSELLALLENSFDSELLPYIYLRLGDIADIRGDRDEALNMYKLISPALTSGGERLLNAPYIMQSMAMAESSMKSGKNNEALELFNGLLSGPMPIGFDLSEIVSLEMVLIYAHEELELEAFNRAKEFVLLYPDNAHIDEVRSIIDTQTYKVITNSKRELNNNSLLNYYYENRWFIREKRTLMLVGNLLLRQGFLFEANRVFTTLWKRGANYTDIDLLSGLVKSEALIGRTDEAVELLSRAAPLGRSDKVKIIDSWRVVGDIYYRLGEERSALRAYIEVRKGLYDASVELKYASILTKLKRSREAITVYRSLLKRAPATDIKGLAYQGAARSYVELNEPELALKNYGLALGLVHKKRLGGIHYKIGEINYAMGRGSRALEAWQMAVVEDEVGLYKELAALRIEEFGIWEEARL